MTQWLGPKSRIASNDYSIHAGFLRCVSRHPHRIAITCGSAEITYADLAAQAARIAHHLRITGVRPGQIVGLYVQRTPGAIAAILGVLAVGAAYLPFDPSYPTRLLERIYDESGPAIMLIDDTLLEHTPNRQFWKGQGLRLGDLLGSDEACDLMHSTPAKPDDLAYVMYTSGSTGRPKGVMVPCRAVLRLVVDNVFATLAGETFLQLAPLSFDASTFEIWGALLNGGKLAILPSLHPSLDEIAEAIKHHGVTTLWLTAGLFHLMVEQRLDGLTPLRQLIAGGDVLSPQIVAKALHGLPECKLINGYGPTENTTFTSCHQILPGDEEGARIPIGRPIAGTELYVVDENGQLAPPGLTGELYIGGEGLALGYLRQPDITAERFIADPFSTAPGKRLYRSGDRVRVRDDGNLEFLGRIDRQIKINGKRVELDELEACLRRSHLVADAAAVCQESANGHRRIAVYVTPSEPSANVIGALKAFLYQELPAYMLPSSIVVLAELPLNPAGKVDRTRMRELTASLPEPPRATASPANAIEATLLVAWRQVLGVDAIDVEQNFFDIGGTSLQLVQLHALLRTLFDCDLTMVDMFRHPRISALAAHIARAATADGAAMSLRDRAREQQAAFERARRPQDINATWESPVRSAR